MAISVIDSLGSAFGRVGRVLFTPFDAGKWFVLGFCAWLAYLGEGGVGFRVGGRWGGDGGGPPLGDAFEEVGEWVEEHLVLVISAAVIVFLVLVAIGLVLSWVRARGKFMFLDGVVRNRGAVVEPWRQFRPLGNSLFWFHLVFGLIAFGVFVLIGLLAVAIAWGDIEAEEFGVAAIAAIVTGLVLWFPCVLTAAVVSLFLEDFVIPVMYLRNLRAVPAWRVFYHELLCGHVVPIVLFYLMKIVLFLGLAVATCLVTCCTCCLAALPYLGTVILLPLFVFRRSYSLYFIQGFGDAWTVFRDEAPLLPEQAPG